MIEVDRIMMEDFSIPVELMMEHAAINLAKLVVHSYPTLNPHQLILVIAGSGNNGAGGITAARKLIGWGYNVKLFLPKGRDKLRVTAKEQLSRLEKISDVLILEDFDELGKLKAQTKIVVLVDAYIGYGFKGEADVISQDVFKLMEDHQDVISLDTPSGLNTTTGVNVGNVMPKATLTLAFPKIGMIRDIYVKNSHFLGDIFLADIGVPKIVYESMLGINWNAQEINQKILNKVYRQFTTSSFIPVELHQKGTICGWTPKI